jgi:hypothetical protein
LAKGIGLQDAIGKYHEVTTVKEILRRFPSAQELNPDRRTRVIARYLPTIERKPELKEKLIAVARPTVHSIIEYLNRHFQVRTSEIAVVSVDLASEIYRSDRLNTTDITVTAKTKNQPSQKFPFSLKALERENSQPNLKNPGLGKLIEAQYFDCGSLKELISELRKKFYSGELDYPPIYKPQPDTTNRHANVLYIAAESAYEQLRRASKDQTIKGIKALIGEVPWVIAYYGENKAVLIDLPSLEGEFSISRSPTPINITISWGNQALILRVKFATGTSEDYLEKWSSLKLAVRIEHR